MRKESAQENIKIFLPRKNTNTTRGGEKDISGSDIIQPPHSVLTLRITKGKNIQFNLSSPLFIEKREQEKKRTR
jgi:hypothetical protein